MFTKETALLFLLDALRDSLSRSLASCLIQEELSSSSSGSLAVCPRASAMIHHRMRRGLQLAHAALLPPERWAAMTQASSALQNPLAEPCPRQTPSVREVLMGTRKDEACGHFNLCI